VTVPKIRSCYWMISMQPSQFKFIKMSPSKVHILLLQISRFSINQKSEFCGPYCIPLLLTILTSGFNAIPIIRTSRRNLLTSWCSFFPLTSFVFFFFRLGFLLYLTPLRVVGRLSNIPCTVDSTSLPQGHRIPPCTNRFSKRYSTVLLLRCIWISCHPLLVLPWPLFCMHLSPYKSTQLLWFRFDYPEYRPHLRTVLCSPAILFG
jgi:hypothetical protein